MEAVEKVVEEVKDETEEIKQEEEVKEEPAWKADPEDEANMPVATHLKTKRKLKGVIGERDAELEQLKSEMEQLKAQTPQAPTKSVKRPKLDDFETDEEYEAAMDTYDDARFNSISDRVMQNNTQRTQQDDFRSKVDTGVGNHYTRVDKLVDEFGVDPEVYKSADSAVRQAVEAVRPKQGNESVDFLLSNLGDESGKVMFQLGRDKKLLAEFQAILLDDPRGIKAAVFLGGMEERVKLNTKKTSHAPPPADSVSGDVAPKGQSAASKKAYDKAEGQEAYKIKSNARKAGIDTKEW